MKNTFISILIASAPLSALPSQAAGAPAESYAPDSTAQDSTAYSRTLQEVTVRSQSGRRSSFRVTNTEVIGQGELIRAACCNLGESFTTNPSVDVSYSDAATGARQIKLLGLSGTYVQMLTENMPNLRGASIPYSLGYVPGPWLQSIQVSKGASSVKNGYESVTGQINIEYLKPQATDGVRANAYLDDRLRQEVNLDGSIHLNPRLSTSMLLHYENRQTDHDRDHDGFMDMPKLRQLNGMWRMAYVSPSWISQMSLKALHDERTSGMSHKHATSSAATPAPHYGIAVNTNRYEAQWKNGITIDHGHNTSLALMLNGSVHDAENTFGKTLYNVRQTSGYAQLMFETDITAEHNISVGGSVNHDSYRQRLDLYNPVEGDMATLLGPADETTSGLYAQYTYRMGDKLTVMPGIRWDHSSAYGGFLTPRLHVRYAPWSYLTLRASAGKGYRSPHALAENVSLLASGKTFVAQERLRQEEAWNSGLSLSVNVPVAGRKLEVNADYYYTTFQNQMVVDAYSRHAGSAFVFQNLSGRSYSHTAQIDITYPIIERLTATGAYRYTDARTTYSGTLLPRPLTSRYKALLTLGYKTPLELWQIDVTASANGHGYLYDHSRYPAYFQLQAQVTRELRHLSLYIGGENLTGYTISEPIRGASAPWSALFDATQVWGPTDGAMLYIGVRFKLEKMF
ncbi:MAG: TonB-dependent receptor [Bacteroidales bacterium]|nr:TonB-dependent receptor [Bacteroidales bacterium]